MDKSSKKHTIFVVGLIMCQYANVINVPIGCAVFSRTYTARHSELFNWHIDHIDILAHSFIDYINILAHSFIGTLAY